MGTEGSFESLLRWAADHGISDSVDKQSSHSCLGRSLCVCFFPDAGGRGLGAVRHLTKGELVLKVPKSVLLTTQSLSLQDEKLSMALKRYPSLSSTQKLTFCLLYEIGKGSSSWWFPYFKHLPTTYETLATFGEFEKQALQVDYALWEAEKAASKSHTEWRGVKGLMEESNIKNQLQTFKAWLWASATISSRALYVPWDEAGCLCPVGDLFNYAAPEGESLDIMDVSSFSQHASLNGNITTDGLHKEEQDTQRALTDGGFEENVSAYCFYARESYKRGEQVLLSYGTYSNLELLQYYGFLLQENPNDRVFIPLEHEIYSSSSWPKESLFIHQNGNPSFALLSALRLWATHPNKRRGVGHLAYAGSQLSVKNEVLVMQWLSKNCHAVLNNLPTSVEEDNQLLCNICKIQDLQGPTELGKMLLTVGGEFCAFLETYGLVNREETELHLTGKIKRSLERWKLAVQWRILYKKALVDCTSYCTRTTCSLSS
ncbi:protein SET DOMAIN GROUP 40 isoform X1 [Cucurbita maxima]|uniref:Protein SET DOMAIN GROUP 40 isoform X1 n=2 Tax=Cucurbita maxima TaxID=3661 RepID=A0A6J1J6L6_CUCMA|nr:protein SET DOMAIN GROUP 40 isoform X1 [Cucurbita maxima]